MTWKVTEKKPRLDLDRPILPTSLMDAAISAGLNPISMERLDEYKRVQIARHPPHWLGKFQDVFFAVPILVGLVVGGIGYDLAIRFDAGVYAYFGVIIATVAIIIGGLSLPIRVKGPARWHEIKVPVGALNLFNVPLDIRNIVDRLLVECGPDIEPVFSKGTLFQDRVDLDPYLVACWEDKKICLGIWDDTGLILTA